MNQQKMREIISIEWEMFRVVHGTQGLASCQQDEQSFAKTRACQFASWPDTLLDSYHADLEHAARSGRNLIWEKYAWMMHETDPAAFASLAERLPALSEETKMLVYLICTQESVWAQEFARDYPGITQRGRPLTQDNSLETSVNTYLWGELCTYSLQTLRIFWQFIQKLTAKEQNLHRSIMEYTMMLYGFDSLETAEKFLSRF